MFSRGRNFARWLPAKLGYRHGPRIMSFLRQRWVLVRHPHADVRFGRGVYLGPGFSLSMPGTGSFVVGDFVEFRHGFRAEINGSGRVVIGSGSRFTYAVVIQCTTSIEIGERCVFAQAAMLLDGQHRFRDASQPMLDQGYDFHPLRIDEDVAVMSKCTVMSDIGRHAFIGAHAVVTTPIPAYCLAVGAPARVVDYFGPPGGDPRKHGAAVVDPPGA